MRAKWMVGVGVAAAFLLTLSTARAQDYPVKLPDHVIEQTYALGATPFVKVQNVNGSITVIGDGSGSVRLQATEKIKARTADLAAEARREVTLKLTHTGDSLDAYVDGPFRRHHWDNPGYQVTFNFVLHVPRGSSLDTHSVNGSLHLSEVRGQFTASTVNGAVDITDAVGAGQANTINGAIKAAFAAQPGGDSSFHTINGTVDITLPRATNARLRYKTLNGSIYTNFEVTPIATTVGSRNHQGMREFRSHRWMSGQIGQGGPQVSVNTLNGNIYIRRGQ